MKKADLIPVENWWDRLEPFLAGLWVMLPFLVVMAVVGLGKLLQ